jgi:AraC-like DNA-binding protein
VKTAAIIRQSYTPVQPTTWQPATGVAYHEYAPDPRLRDWVYCYWQLQAPQPLAAPFAYRVVADGCVDTFFDFADPADSLVMGFCNQFMEFLLHGPFQYVGVRFLPTMFPQLFRVDSSELSHRTLPLLAVAPALAQSIANYFEPGLACHTTVGERLDQCLLPLVAQARPTDDARLFRAIGQILTAPGPVHLPTALDTGLSPRQLRRLFECYVGDTPKIFSQVVRFQRLLRTNPSRQSLRQDKSFFDLGYYDQAHFSKEFKLFSGLTPNQAFGR